MNCEPYSTPKRYLSVLLIAPFYVELSQRLLSEYGAWVFRPGTSCEGQLRKVSEQDDARYTEAVRR